MYSPNTVAFFVELALVTLTLALKVAARSVEYA
jgi:hypothetical protein